MFKLTEVTNKALRKAFLELPCSLYKNDPNWIRPLDSDIENIFNPKKNHLIDGRNCIRWILSDENEKVVGRVAAFYYRSESQDNMGGMGFFECIDNKEAAFQLFDACKNWLIAAGLKGMDGPINFGDRDHWWGLLCEGFEQPNYGIPYNFPYYRKFFEEYGFGNYFNQYTYRRPLYGVENKLSDIVNAKAARVLSDPRYSFRTFEPSKSDEFADYFMEIYNKGWVKYTGVDPITPKHARHLMKMMKPILDPRILWFGFYEDQPIAFYIMIPDINQILRHLNGKLNLPGLLKFLYYKRKPGTVDKCLGIIFGIIPEHQGKGVESAIVKGFEKQVYDIGLPYKNLEMNWIGDFNPAMMRVASQMGGKICKTHITYRYLFDRSAPFTRCPRVNSQNKKA